jgi:hypothetical protein
LPGVWTRSLANLPAHHIEPEAHQKLAGCGAMPREFNYRFESPYDRSPRVPVRAEPEAHQKLAGGGASLSECNHRVVSFEMERPGGSARTVRFQHRHRHHKYRSSYSTMPRCNIARYSS